MSFPNSGYHHARALLDSKQRKDEEPVFASTLDSTTDSLTSELFGRFSNPEDKHWRKPRDKAPRLLLPILGVTTTLVILNIAALAYSAVYEKDHREESSVLNTNYVLPIRWSGEMDKCSRATAAPIIVGTVFEFLHQPIHLGLFLKSRLLPITAIALSVIAATIWLFIPSYEIAAIACIETTALQSWRTLAWVRAAFAYLAAGLYLTYAGCAMTALFSPTVTEHSERTPTATSGQDDQTLYSEKAITTKST